MYLCLSHCASFSVSLSCMAGIVFTLWVCVCVSPWHNVILETPMGLFHWHFNHAALIYVSISSLNVLSWANPCPCYCLWRQSCLESCLTCMLFITLDVSQFCVFVWHVNPLYILHCWNAIWNHIHYASFVFFRVNKWKKKGLCCGAVMWSLCKMV